MDKLNIDRSADQAGSVSVGIRLPVPAVKGDQGSAPPSLRVDAAKKDSEAPISPAGPWPAAEAAEADPYSPEAPGARQGLSQDGEVVEDDAVIINVADDPAGERREIFNGSQELSHFRGQD